MDRRSLAVARNDNGVARRHFVLEGLDDSRGDLRAESWERGNRLRPRVAHSLQAAECLEQLPSFCLADAGDAQQLRGNRAHRPAFALKRDGEEMVLVAGPVADPPTAGG